MSERRGNLLQEAPKFAHIAYEVDSLGALRQFGSSPVPPHHRDVRLLIEEALSDANRQPGADTRP